MDKYEFKIKAEQMQRLVERKDYKMAAKIADGIDWRRVKNVELLTTVSEIYEKMERYEDSYEILNMAYDRAPIGRMIVFKMAEMATRMGEFDEATELYKEFVKIAPHDLSRYILKYKIYQAKGAPIEDQIAILEEFKGREYHEKWAYELAVLYYKEGMNAKCVEECDDLVLWFSEGEYVRRALELKMRIQPLTASQEEKYRELMQNTGHLEPLPIDGEAGTDNSRKKEEPGSGEEPKEEAKAPEKEEIKVRTMNPDERYNTVNLQAELAAGLKDLFQEDSETKEETQEAGDLLESAAEEPEPAPEKQAEEKQPQAQPKEERPQAQPAEEKLPKEKPALKEHFASQAEPLHLGQSEDGQLTFNAQENVLERQITGQLTIEEIMAEWEVKKQQMEAKLARLAKAEQERKEAEALRRKQEEEQRQEELRKKQLSASSDASAAFVGTESLIPPEVQKLLDEIEGKLPVKIIVEPIERTEPGFLQEEAADKEAAEEPVAEESAPAEESMAEENAPAEEFMAAEDAKEAVEEAPAGEAEEEEALEDMAVAAKTAAEAEPQQVEQMEEEAEETPILEQRLPDIEEETEDDLPEEIDEIEAILTAALEEEMAGGQEPAPEKTARPQALKAERELERTAEPVREPEPERAAEPEEQPKAAFRKEEPASNMMWDLEKVLEDELKHVSGQRLSEEQEKLFAYFTSVHGMNQQLSLFLEEEEQRKLDGTSVTGNLVVTGESGNGKTTLAVDLVKAVQKQRKAKGSKMAKVTGEALSQKDIGAVVRKLSGGALVIEHAGGLTTEAAAQLSGAMLGQTGNLFVILEDEPSEIRRLFKRCESLAAKFQRTIEIPVFTNNELVAFGKSYGQEQGYVLDEMAVLALYNRIGNNQTSDHLVNVAEVKEMVDEAIISSSRKGVKKLFSKRRQDEFGNYVLLEKDFEV